MKNSIYTNFYKSLLAQQLNKNNKTNIKHMFERLIAVKIFELLKQNLCTTFFYL